MSRTCSNCGVDLPSKRRLPFCLRCSKWQKKVTELRGKVQLIPEGQIRHGSNAQVSHWYGLRVALRVLEEFRWREEGRRAREVEVARVRSLLFALAAAYRIPVDDALSMALESYSAAARKGVHDLLLLMLERLPTAKPVLHMDRRPQKGHHYNNGGWTDWGTEYWRLSFDEQRRFDRHCLGLSE